MTTAHAVKAAGARYCGEELSNRALSLRVSGFGRKRPETAGQSARQNRFGHYHRTPSGDHAEMVAEYTTSSRFGAATTELPTAHRRRPNGPTDFAEARIVHEIEEWLLAGEYVLANRKSNLMFCERGIRTFETYTRQYA